MSAWSLAFSRMMVWMLGIKSSPKIEMLLLVNATCSAFRMNLRTCMSSNAVLNMTTAENETWNTPATHASYDRR
jgi:hypothetical protein